MSTCPHASIYMTIFMVLANPTCKQYMEFSVTIVLLRCKSIKDNSGPCGCRAWRQDERTRRENNIGIQVFHCHPAG